MEPLFPEATFSRRAEVSHRPGGASEGALHSWHSPWYESEVNGPVCELPPSDALLL